MIALSFRIHAFALRMKTVTDKAADTGELDPRIQQAIAGRNPHSGPGWATASTWLASA
jgi:hypothetical protein